MLEKPYFFGILKFAAKQILSAVEEAHAGTWLTDMEVSNAERSRLLMCWLRSQQLQQSLY